MGDEREREKEWERLLGGKKGIPVKAELEWRARAAPLWTRVYNKEEWSVYVPVRWRIFEDLCNCDKNMGGEDVKSRFRDYLNWLLLEQHRFLITYRQGWSTDTTTAKTTPCSAPRCIQGRRRAHNKLRTAAWNAELRYIYGNICLACVETANNNNNDNNKTAELWTVILDAVQLFLFCACFYIVCAFTFMINYIV